jgi:heme A synthase
MRLSTAKQPVTWKIIRKNKVMEIRSNKLAKYAWSVTLYNILVILWGAYVRATGSGAGCGSHWPLCNGVVIPRTDEVATAIEFTHRVTSGLAFLLVLGLLIWVLRSKPKGHHLRWSSWGAMIFMISESLVGAGLVLFEWVAGNISTARVVVMGIHLANTMMLLFFLSLTSWLASGGQPVDIKKGGRIRWLLLVGFTTVLLMSMAGAVTALGDTLFPADTLAGGIQAELSPAAHFLVRLRVWHPFFAVAVGLYLFYLARYLFHQRTEPIVHKFTLGMVGVYGIQLGAGALNLILLVPIWMQIIHLFLATLVWISLTLLSASVLAGSARAEESGGNLR